MRTDQISFRPPGWTTLSLHGGQEPDPVNGSRAVPLYQTTAYNFSDAADGASKFAWSKEGYVYTRMGNPTNSVFEQRMSMLEGGVGAVATASGHAAQVISDPHTPLSNNACYCVILKITSNKGERKGGERECNPS